MNNSPNYQILPEIWGLLKKQLAGPINTYKHNLKYICHKQSNSPVGRGSLPPNEW